MNDEDQTEVIEYLTSPSTHGGAAVDRIETHSAIVFLAGERAWKLKRAVRYDYLDFTGVDRRRELCEAEVRINRRTAPALYRGVVAVTRELDGSLALGGPGPAVDWVIEMVRFDQEALLDRLAARGALDLDLMPPLAAAIAELHTGAERRFDHGGRSGMAWVIEGNDEVLVARGPSVLDEDLVASMTSEARRALDRHGPLLDLRREQGFVRHCHGDLHLRNIVLFAGQPTLFDAVEFNDEIACTDVWYDTAFLLMDLWKRRLPDHANAAWNGYLAESGDLAGLPLVPLFLSCRAAVRAKTSLVGAALQSEASRRAEMQELARQYLGMAFALLRPPPPCLIAIGGLSGSGKSSLARIVASQIGAAPGAVVLRSDTIRKRLCGKAELEPLGAAGYTPEVSLRVYETLAERAALVLRSGHAAIVDAVFQRDLDRAAIEEVARRESTPFVGCWLEAPRQALLERVERRERDASEADAEVVRLQLREATGPISWERVDASAGASVVADRARSLLRRRVPGHIQS